MVVTLYCNIALFCSKEFNYYFRSTCSFKHITGTVTGKVNDKVTS